jgi:hypothetical protein
MLGTLSVNVPLTVAVSSALEMTRLGAFNVADTTKLAVSSVDSMIGERTLNAKLLFDITETVGSAV